MDNDVDSEQRIFCWNIEPDLNYFLLASSQEDLRKSPLKARFPPFYRLSRHVYADSYQVYRYNISYILAPPNQLC